MKIDFYYWGSMCPISNEIIQRLKRYDTVFDIHFFDFTDSPALARKEKIFFPFLTVVNGERRYYSPISEKFMHTLLAGEMPEETPYRPTLGTTEKNVEILPITETNYDLASRCTGRTPCPACEQKADMYSDLPGGIMGFMNVDGGKLLGGVEYYPSLHVPYDIPKGEETAFITCVYLSDRQFDYKTGPLRALEQYLAQLYKRAVVISDEDGVFPNGDLAFFKRSGYQDEKIIFEDAYCRLHLLSKELPVSSIRKEGMKA